MASAARPLTLLGMCRRNLYRQPVRTSLTALGVAVGVVAIVAFGATTRGFWASTNAAIHFAESDMMVFQAGVAADLFSSLDEKATRAALLADPDVADVASYLWQVMPAEGMPFAFLIGLNPERMGEHQHRLLRGRYVKSDDEIILGSIAAKILNKDVGDRMWIGREIYRIVGVFETEVVYFNGAIVMSLSKLQAISHKPGQVTSFQVRVRPGVDGRVVADRLERTIPGIVAIVSAEQYKKVDKGLEIASFINRRVSFLAIVVGGIIVTNTMWMAVNERTREIGVLRAMGWSKRGIVAMIIAESAGVGLIAWVVGCLGGVGLAKLSTELPIAAQFVDPVYDWQPFCTALAVAVVLSILGGALPAWRAARISPVEALRHE
ncbi:MAG TPA: FtsX-like permease family protein [Phycisphaerae bacterium]|nr:FtsX-like permease family protein [Phycisphaerae bacterium]